MGPATLSAAHFVPLNDGQRLLTTIADMSCIGQRDQMTPFNYFLPEAASETDLFDWSPILPSPVRILQTNLFGDAFVLVDDGTVHMLERASHSAQLIASSEEEFWKEVEDDLQGWQLRRLVDECRLAGKILKDGQCYAFTTLPIFGGDYVVENIWVVSWEEWFLLTADIFTQIKDLPDGTTVRLQVV